jgi:hypothetical protein
MDPLVTDKSAKAADIHFTLDYLQEELLDKIKTLEYQAKVLQDRAHDLEHQARTLAELAKEVKADIKGFDKLWNHVEGLSSSSEGDDDSEDLDLLSAGSCDCSVSGSVQQTGEDLKPLARSNAQPQPDETKPLTKKQAHEKAQHQAREWASALQTAKGTEKPSIDFQGVTRK